MIVLGHTLCIVMLIGINDLDLCYSKANDVVLLLLYYPNINTVDMLRFRNIVIIDILVVARCVLCIRIDNVSSYEALFCINV